MRKLAVLTGAGVSAESGVRTFRDAGGLWEGHRIEDVATPEAWRRQPAIVLDFYNQRRRQLLDVRPNAAHMAIAEAEKDFDVTVITQNVDDLHERAGSTRVIHLHGELLKVRSTGDERLVYEWRADLVLGDKCEKGFQLRPHIVWFGEMVPMLEHAIPIVAAADAILVVGSSMQVYPAASLVGFARRDARIVYVDPDPKLNHELAMRADLAIIAKPASEGVPEAMQVLMAGNR
jgi:NAD-dependent deacetylase